MINIVGLGYGEIDDLTIKTYKILKESKNIYIKNTDLKIIKSLEEEGILFKNSSNLFKDIRHMQDCIGVLDMSWNDHGKRYKEGTSRIEH